MDFAVLFDGFIRELNEVEKNSNLFRQIQNTIKSNGNHVFNDSRICAVTKEMVEKFGLLMHTFNVGIDKVFDDFNKYISDGELSLTNTIQQPIRSKCQITRIVNAQERICYARDVNGDILAKLNAFWKEAPFRDVVPVDDTHGLGDVFGVEIDNSIMNRGKFVFDPTINSVRVQLIDTGDLIDIENCNLQNLPNDIMSMPACAFLCKIYQIGSDEAQSLSDSLKHQIFDYRIRAIDESSRMLHIDIYTTNPFLVGYSENTDWKTLNDLDDGMQTDTNMDGNDVRSNLEQTINKILQLKWNITMGNSSKKCSIYNSNYDLNENTSNDFQLVENRNAIASNFSASSSDVNTTASLGAMPKLIAMQQPKEKSISIKNRCGDSATNVRLAGNKRQANTINGSSGIQWNGPNNREQRRRLNSTEMTFNSIQPMQSQRETLFLQSHHNKLKIPRPGEPMTVIPTCVLSATQFYGQLGKYFNAVEYAQRRLNNWRSRYEYELHTQIPAKMDLVVVLLRNAGGYHRARLLDFADDQHITVFLLDYGTTHEVQLRHIFKWTPECDKNPFYSVIFKLSNIQPDKAQQPNAIDYVKQKIPTTLVSAEMTDVDDHSISVRLFDHDGFDIGEEINCYLVDP